MWRRFFKESRGRLTDTWLLFKGMAALFRFTNSISEKSIFYVQIHNLLFSLLTIEAILNIGETLGFVTIPKVSGEMKGGSFIKVRAEVDITKPLCRGRKISWDQDYKGWATFMYDRLSNICNWSGHVSHNDKECVVWLGNKGSLQVDEQQFGP